MCAELQRRPAELEEGKQRATLRLARRFGPPARKYYRSGHGRRTPTERRRLLSKPTQTMGPLRMVTWGWVHIRGVPAGGYVASPLRSAGAKSRPWTCRLVYFGRQRGRVRSPRGAWLGSDSPGLNFHFVVRE